MMNEEIRLSSDRNEDSQKSPVFLVHMSKNIP